MLNVEFYRSYYGDLSQLDEDALRAHWEADGQREGRYANAEQVLADLLKSSELPAEFDLRAYLALNQDVADAIRFEYEAVQHFLQHGRAEDRPFRFVGPAPSAVRQVVDAALGEQSKADPGLPSGASVSVSERAADDPVDKTSAARGAGNGAADAALLFAAPEALPADFDAEFVRLVRPDFSHLGAEALGEAWLALERDDRPVPCFERFLREHRNAGALDETFDLATYLARNGDIAASVETPVQGLIHFLQFGLDEGRSAVPEAFDAEFVADLYGIEADAEEDTAADVLERIRAKIGAGLSDLVHLSEDALCAAYGIRAFRFRNLFDHEDYRARAFGPEGAQASRAEALEHFCRVGMGEGQDFNSDWVFDPFFYEVEYAEHVEALRPVVPAGEGAGDAEDRPDIPAERLYRHFLRSGLEQGWVPNLRILVKQTYNLDLPPAVEAQLPGFRLVADGIDRFARPSDVCRRLVEGGGPALEYIRINDAATAEFFTGVADRFSVNGNTEAADLVYSRVLSAFPDYPRALRHQADQVQRLGSYGLAARLREDIIERAAGNEWTYLNLAECYTRLGRRADAADVLNRSVRAYPGDVGLRLRAQQSAREGFQSIWKNAGARALAQGIAPVQAELRKALEAMTPAFDTPVKEREIRSVAIVGNEDLAQCKLYRIDQKIGHLRTAGYTVDTFNFNSDIPAYCEVLSEYDATIFYRVPAFPHVIDAIVKTSEFGIPTFYEIDDMIFDPEHFPPSYPSYAGQITREQHASMACGVPLFEHAMRLCDYGIASTTPLQQLMSERVRTGQVFLHRNAFGRLHESAMRDALPRDPERPVTIFYGSGTKAHKQDFQDLIEPALVDIVRKYGDRVRILVIGYIEKTKRLKSIEKNLVMMEPIWDVEDYWRVLSQVDINLSVLAPSLLADCKSEIKWMEAAMFAIPSVVSRTATHTDVIRDGVTGFLCDSAMDFTRHIDALVCDPELRSKVGEQARAEVLEAYSVKAQATNIDRILKSVRPAPNRRKTRVLIVNVFYPPQAIGGATRVVDDNVRDLRARFGDELEIDVVCTLEGGQTPYEIGHYARDGVRVFTITAPSDPDIDKKPTDPKMAAAFARCLDRIQPDLVHFHCIQRLTAAAADEVRQRQIPYLITAHDGWWVSDYQFLVDGQDEIQLYDYSPGNLAAFSGQSGYERQNALRKALFGAEFVLPVSPAFAEIYREARVSRIRPVENGVSNLPDCTRVPSSDGRVRLAHIGGAARHKGFHLVRTALRTRPFDNLHLTVIDHAMPKGMVRHEVWGTTPVTLRAKVSQSDIGDLYAGIDILLAPSIWPESYGLVTREALACGCWVIASDRGAIGDCIQEGENGHRIDVSDVNGLIDVLTRVDATPGRYLRAPDVELSLRTAEQQAEELASLYRDVLARLRVD